MHAHVHIKMCVHMHLCGYGSAITERVSVSVCHYSGFVWDYRLIGKARDLSMVIMSLTQRFGP